MAQARPDSDYTVQRGDTLSSIAKQAYGDANQWQIIFNDNRQAIGDDPNRIVPGEVLYIPLLPQHKTCIVTAPDGLNVRVAPTVPSPIVASYPQGTVLNFVDVVKGENVDGNYHWGHSEQGHYFWLGGTDHPNG